MCIDAEIMVITEWKEWLLVLCKYSICVQFLECVANTHITYLFEFNIFFIIGWFWEEEVIIKEKVHKHNRFFCVLYTFLHKQFAYTIRIAPEAWIFIQIPFTKKKRRKFDMNKSTRTIYLLKYLHSVLCCLRVLFVVYLAWCVVCTRMVTQNNKVRLIWFMSCRALQRKYVDSRMSCK